MTALHSSGSSRRARGAASGKPKITDTWKRGRPAIAMTRVSADSRTGLMIFTAQPISVLAWASTLVEPWFTWTTTRETLAPASVMTAPPLSL